MDFELSTRARAYVDQVRAFMDEHVFPSEAVFARQLEEGPSRWSIPPVMEDLKARARRAGLWNLFLPDSEYGPGLTNLEYAPLCEVMGASPLLAEATNCAAPDTGNMEVLAQFGTDLQREQWLQIGRAHV